VTLEAQRSRIRRIKCSIWRDAHWLYVIDVKHDPRTSAFAIVVIAILARPFIAL
jgi:hypothetical protein